MKKKSRRHYSAYSGFQKLRCRGDWLGGRPADAYKEHWGHHRTIPARRGLFAICEEKQKLLVQKLHAGEIKAKPQIAAFFLFPGPMAAQATVGWTLMVEARHHLSEKNGMLAQSMKTYLQSLCELNNPWPGQQKMVAKFAQIVVDAVDIRLLMYQLTQEEAFWEVEAYRLLIGNTVDPARLRTVEQAIQWAVNFDELMPTALLQQMPGLFKQSLLKIRELQRPYLLKLAGTAPLDLLPLGEAWAKDLIDGLAGLLCPANSGPGRRDEPTGLVQLQPGAEEMSPADEVALPLSDSDKGEGMDALLPLMDDESVMEAAGTELITDLTEVAKTLLEACNLPADWEDLGFDDMERMLGVPFQNSPIEGELTEGEMVEITLGDKALSGEILETSLAVSRDQQLLDELLGISLPIARLINQLLYTNMEEVTRQYLSATGSRFDSRRLALAGISPMVFQQTRWLTRPDQYGKPMVVVAADGSGSMSGNEIRCLQVLVASWIRVAKSSKGLKVLAGLYNQSRGNSGTIVPTVHWIFHEQKHFGAQLDEIIGRVASIRATGTNYDALSVTYMLQQAHRIGRSNERIYLIFISDTNWCCSYPGSGMSGSHEVVSVLQYFKRGPLKDRFHITLVALSDKYDPVHEEVDILIKISKQDLTNFTRVAGHITGFVARAIRSDYFNQNT